MKKLGKKLEKIICEICSESDKSTLHKHHIIPRTDPNCTDHPFNLAVICSNCHNKVHAEVIKIIGIYPSTKLPYHRTLIYETIGNGNNSGITEPYYIPKPKSIKWYGADDED